MTHAMKFINEKIRSSQNAVVFRQFRDIRRLSLQQAGINFMKMIKFQTLANYYVNVFMFPIYIQHKAEKTFNLFPFEVTNQTYIYYMYYIIYSYFWPTPLS